MSTEQNKKMAIEVFARFTACDIAVVLDTMTDDATWLIPRKPDAYLAAVLYTKAKISGLFHAMLGRLGDSRPVDGLASPPTPIGVVAMTDLHNRVISRVGEPAAKLTVIHGAQTVVELPTVPVRRTAPQGELGVRMKACNRTPAFLRVRIEQRVRPPGRCIAPVAQHPVILVALAATAVSA